MQMGFGVDVVIYNLYQNLIRMGIQVTVGCIEKDDTYDDINIIKLSAQASEIVTQAKTLGVTHVIAHTSPFFELLPQINASIPCWSYEHGDPTPSFFPQAEAKEREAIKQYKQQHCYPHTQGTIAISEFIKYDISKNTQDIINNTQIIHNGCDHLIDMGSKPLELFALREKPLLKIGCLMRMGQGESFYKGNQLIIELFNQLKESRLPFEFHVMGRGTAEDAKALTNQGIITHLNASETEKINYLRDLDIFISLSLWEGFNLPLVEAQSLGTVSIALDCGAHPEVTPYVMSSLSDLQAFIMSCHADHKLIYQASKKCYHFVHHHFQWQNSALELQKILLNHSAAYPGISITELSKSKKFLINLKEHGLRSSLARTFGYFKRRFTG